MRNTRDKPPAIKAYKPETDSISSGQVLQEPNGFEKGRLVLRELTDQLLQNGSEPV